MRLLTLPTTLLALLPYAFALPAHSPVPPKPLPLLIWHGLGDRYNAEGLHTAGILAQKVHPGTYVHYIRIDDDGNQDRTDSFFGNVSEQVEKVCQDLKDDVRLKSWQHDHLDSSVEGNSRIRVDALGFSQGGQFLRGLLQRCDGLSIRSLVTFGSQHNGIAEFQVCGAYDFLCKGATALIKGNAWTDYVQSHVVPAQYYRTLNQTTGLASDDYLEHSSFLADINNERALKNVAYAKEVSSLENLVMYVFENDTTVIPKESGWFAEVNSTDPENPIITPLRNRTIYKEDWIGLKKLDEKGRLHFKIAPGGHMQLKQNVLADAYREFFGPETNRKGDALVGEPFESEEVLPLLREQTSFLPEGVLGGWKENL
jgi:palmitoyl-protein thioesterase